MKPLEHSILLFYHDIFISLRFHHNFFRFYVFCLFSDLLLLAKLELLHQLSHPLSQNNSVIFIAFLVTSSVMNDVAHFSDVLHVKAGLVLIDNMDLHLFSEKRCIQGGGEITIIMTQKQKYFYDKCVFVIHSTNSWLSAFITSSVYFFRSKNFGFFIFSVL